MCQKNRVEVSSRLDSETAKTFVHRSDPGLMRETLIGLAQTGPKRRPLPIAAAVFRYMQQFAGAVGIHFYDLSYNAGTISASSLFHKSQHRSPQKRKLMLMGIVLVMACELSAIGRTSSGVGGRHTEVEIVVLRVPNYHEACNEMNNS